MHAVVEAYYTINTLAVLLGFSQKWVAERVKAGDFGAGCFFVNGDYRVPASGVNAFIQRNPVPETTPPVIARTVGEARRKLQEMRQSKRLEAAA